MSLSRHSDREVEDVVIAGCPVHLIFRRSPTAGWRVDGAVECGQVEERRIQTFATEFHESRESAERAAFQTAGELLGHNVDRNTSRGAEPE